MKALTNLEKNLFNQTTTQEINRVAVCRAFLSDDLKLNNFLKIKDVLDLYPMRYWV